MTTQVELRYSCQCKVKNLLSMNKHRQINTGISISPEYKGTLRQDLYSGGNKTKAH